MSVIAVPKELKPSLPDHTQLPDKDGAIVTNFQELPQTMLLTESIRPVLEQLHPDKQYVIGCDSGIYWKITDPPLAGCKAPDWFYVANVPPDLNGEARRSYVLWQEKVPPLIAIEYVSGDGSDERDRTPLTGKFWVYEQGIRIPYYAIYEVRPGKVDVFQLNEGRYELMVPNQRGHFSIAPLGVELGIWQGEFANLDLPWLRWWDSRGNVLPHGDERIQMADRELNEACARTNRLAEKLKELGVDPNLIK